MVMKEAASRGTRWTAAMSFEEEIVVSVREIFFTQESIAVTFKRPRDHERIDEAVELINQGYLSPRAFPNIKVVEFHERLWSLDNRRLWVFKKAGVPSVTVTLLKCGLRDRLDGFHDRLECLASPIMYMKLSRPGFFPRIRGDCKENFTEGLDPAELPSFLSPPQTPYGRGGGGRMELPTRIYNLQPIPSSDPCVQEPDRLPRRPKSPPPAKVSREFSTVNRSKHLNCDHHWPTNQFYDYRDPEPFHHGNYYDKNYRDQFIFRNQQPDLPSMPTRMRNSQVLPPPFRKHSDRPSRLNTKKRHHETEVYHRPTQRLHQEACSLRPSKKMHRAPSQVSEFEASSPEPPSGTPFEACSSHPAKRSTNPTPVSREGFNAFSPQLSRRRQEERPPSHTRGLNSSAPKPPVPIPRDKTRGPRGAEEPRPPLPTGRTRSSERRAGQSGNPPSFVTTERKDVGSCHHGQQPSRRNPLDKRAADVPPVLYSQKGREAKSSRCAAAAGKSPPPAQARAPAPKRNRSSKAMSNPKNFSYDFHSSRKKSRASKISKKAAAPPSGSTKLPTDHDVLDVTVPPPALLKNQSASPPPYEPLLSSSTIASLSTTTEKTQIMDDNSTSVVIDPKLNPKENPKENQVQYSSVSGKSSPTSKTRLEKEQSEAPKHVDFTVEGETLETEMNLFMLDKQAAAPLDPKLPRPSIPSSPILNEKDQEVMNDIVQQLLDEKEGALQNAQAKLDTKPTAGIHQKEPVEAKIPNELTADIHQNEPVEAEIPNKPTADIRQKEPVEAEISSEPAADTYQKELVEAEPQDIPVQVDAHKSAVECPDTNDMKGQLLESALKVLGLDVAPKTAFHGDGEVHDAAANVGVTVTTVLEPPKIQACTPVKGVPEPKTNAKARGAIDRQQNKSGYPRRQGYREMARTANSEANPAVGNEDRDVSKRLTRGQLKMQQETERRKQRAKRRALRDAEKKKAREARKASVQEKSASAPKNLTTAIVPYDATSKARKTLQSGDLAYVKVIGELPGSGVEGRSRLHPYLRFIGPFKVIRRYDPRSARLELPDDCHLRPTVSLTVLTKSRSPLGTYLPDKRLSVTLVPETILHKRVARRIRKRKVIHYLVKWKDLPAKDATWEPETIFDQHRHLLDQVDTPLFCNPYLLRNWKA